VPLIPAARLAPFHPARFPYARFALTLGLGGVAGTLFQALGVPLPWMLGPMCACLAAVLIGMPVAAPAVVRPPMTAMIGVMLGANFTPELVSHIPQWASTLVLQTGLVLLLGLAGALYYRRLAGLDPVTAYYAGMPGGLMEMSLIGEEQGGDGQTIMLIHSARILIVVMTVPFVVQFLEGVQLGPRVASRLSVVETPWTTFVWLIGLGFAGVVIGNRLKLPARNLFGPMLLSMAVHATGLTDFLVPKEVIIGAQILLGCVTGCRFLGYDRRAILRILALSAGATAILLVITVIYCFGLSRLVGLSMAQGLLGFAPAGISEMSLIAIALHFDVSFVIVHQIARIAMIAIFGPIVFRWIGWNRPHGSS